MATFARLTAAILILLGSTSFGPSLQAGNLPPQVRPMGWFMACLALWCGMKDLAKESEQVRQLAVCAGGGEAWLSEAAWKGSGWPNHLETQARTVLEGYREQNYTSLLLGSDPVPVGGADVLAIQARAVPDADLDRSELPGLDPEFTVGRITRRALGYSLDLDNLVVQVLDEHAGAAGFRPAALVRDLWLPIRLAKKVRQEIQANRDMIEKYERLELEPDASSEYSHRAERLWQANGLMDDALERFQRLTAPYCVNLVAAAPCGGPKKELDLRSGRRPFPDEDERKPAAGGKGRRGDRR